MRLLKLHVLFFLSVVMSSFNLAHSADSCATERLCSVIRHLPQVEMSALPAGNTCFFKDKNRTIVVRVNEWNEVAHVGLRIFSEEFRKNNYRPVCDFVERYLLELSMQTPDGQKLRMKNDDVFLMNGEVEEFLDLDETDAVTFKLLDYKAYHVEWLHKGKSLTMDFPMDYQLISGCDIIELEKNYLKNITRYQSRGGVAILPDVPADYEKEYFMQEGGSYQITSVRHDLYYHKKDGVWRLLCDVRKPEWSAFNLALSSVAVGGKSESFMLDMRLDRYGYQTSSVALPMDRWVAYNEEEGGKPYFVVKSVDDSAVKGLVLFPNERGGYCHVMSVEIPVDAIGRGEGTIKGRLFVYVPLHNVDMDSFN